MDLYNNVYDAIVVGTGAAGYSAACRLKQAGRTVLLVTEGVGCGTSRNTGSDKQTYYKLGLGGDSADSVRAMAEDLFRGGSVDGDTALCEAAASAPCFLELCRLGVPFPHNRYGEHVGYKTDHDPYARATSAGPLTSKFMTEALQQEAQRLAIDVLDGHLAVEVLKGEDGVCGLLTLRISDGELHPIESGNVILAVGGPAGIYEKSVYPACHTGAASLFLTAGVSLQNMTQWQYGLASTNPRWNVSGSYMQVLPRLVSVDENGAEHEFLQDFFPSPEQALSMLFLKGYQWPFDSRKVLDGSSVIDLLVYVETEEKGRQVYLDFTKNPFGMDAVPFDKLEKEAYAYLQKAGITFGTPIERLKKLNQPAIDLYLSKGVDLSGDYLPIALCAQHCNGGASVDLWWQTELNGLFAIGECAGTHGIARPGGSALNAGQAGALRAAQYISACPHAPQGFQKAAGEAMARHKKQLVLGDADTCTPLLLSARKRMSRAGAAMRDAAAIGTAKAEVLQELARPVTVTRRQELFLLCKLRDTLLTQAAVLTAMEDFLQRWGVTCGSSLYHDENGALRQGLAEQFRFTPDKGQTHGFVQQVAWKDGAFACFWRPVRPLPREDEAFETVWRQYRQNKNVF